MNKVKATALAAALIVFFSGAAFAQSGGVGTASGSNGPGVSKPGGNATTSGSATVNSTAPNTTLNGSDRNGPYNSSRSNSRDTGIGVPSTPYSK